MTPCPTPGVLFQSPAPGGNCSPHFLGEQTETRGAITCPKSHSTPATARDSPPALWIVDSVFSSWHLSWGPADTSAWVSPISLLPSDCSSFWLRSTYNLIWGQKTQPFVNRNKRGRGQDNALRGLLPRPQATPTVSSRLCP